VRVRVRVRVCGCVDSKLKLPALVSSRLPFRSRHQRVTLLPAATRRISVTYSPIIMSAIIEGEVDADARHVQVIRQLICDVCAQFYNAGWAVGTSGSVAIRYGDQIHTTPSGTLLSHESHVAVAL
jgi:hypothetical protein